MVMNILTTGHFEQAAPLQFKGTVVVLNSK